MQTRCTSIITLALLICLTIALLVSCGGDTTPVETQAPDTEAQTTMPTADTSTQDETTPDTQISTEAATEAATEAFTETITEPATEAETLDPLSATINAADMPTDAENYVVGDTNSDSDITAQYTLLTSHANLYTDKQFTVYGKVMRSADTWYISLGDAGYIAFIKPDGMFGPLEGDEIAISATFAPMENAPTTFVFHVDSFELIERVEAPNGGTWMFVNVNSSLNVRPVPTSSGNDPIGKYFRGDAVEVLEIVDGWAKITYPDAENGYAYVSTSYLLAWEDVPAA